MSVHVEILRETGAHDDFLWMVGLGFPCRPSSIPFSSEAKM